MIILHPTHHINPAPFISPRRGILVLPSHTFFTTVSITILNSDLPLSPHPLQCPTCPRSWTTTLSHRRPYRLKVTVTVISIPVSLRMTLGALLVSHHIFTRWPMFYVLFCSARFLISRSYLHSCICTNSCFVINVIYVCFRTAPSDVEGVVPQAQDAVGTVPMPQALGHCRQCWRRSG